MSTLSDDWLDLAAAHGSTKWVQRFIQTHLPQLEAQTLSAEAFAQSLEEELLTRQLLTPAQQKNYRSNVVQALKSFDATHPAISIVAPTAEEYRELNDAQRGKLAGRETRYLSSDQAQALVDRATELLESAEWSEVGAGLAVLIGRRVSEILLSSFSLKSAWSLNFSEMAKKKGAARLRIEIPTLAPAEGVLRAIEKLQKGLRVEDLKTGSLSPKMAKQTVNGRYSEAIANKCIEHFSDLVPARSDRENLYTHIFRAVYATITAHWFCPPKVPEHNFKAEIQGHFTLTSEGKKLPNFAARANYDDYAIATEDGNRDGRLGIKLGKLPGLEVIEAFRKEIPTIAPVIIDKDKDAEQKALSRSFVASEAPAIETHSSSPTKEITMAKPATKIKTRRPELYLDDLEEMTALMARRGVVGSTGEVFHALIEAFKSGEAAQQQQQTRTVSELTSSLSWFTDRIDALEKTCQQLQEERDRRQAAQTPIEELNRLRGENTQLKRELQETRSRLEGIQKFLGNGSTPAAAVPTPTTHSQLQPPTAFVEIDTTPIVTSAPSRLEEAKAESSVGRRNRGETHEKLNQIVDAIMAWNTSQESSDTQLRISIPTIKGLASTMGANYQKAIQDVLRERGNELDEHHRRLLIGTRHNAGVVRKSEVLQAIARDYLGLENWQEVKY